MIPTATIGIYRSYAARSGLCQVQKMFKKPSTHTCRFDDHLRPGAMGDGRARRPNSINSAGPKRFPDETRVQVRRAYRTCRGKEKNQRRKIHWCSGGARTIIKRKRRSVGVLIRCFPPRGFHRRKISRGFSATDGDCCARPSPLPLLARRTAYLGAIEWELVAGAIPGAAWRPYLF